MSFTGSDAALLMPALREVEMSRWTHASCHPCYEETHPAREAVIVLPLEEEECCFCGDMTESGIYVRWDPTSSKLQCAGVAGTHAQ